MVTVIIWAVILSFVILPLSTSVHYILNKQTTKKQIKKRKKKIQMRLSAVLKKYGFYFLEITTIFKNSL